MRVGLSWICLDSLVRNKRFQWVARLEPGGNFCRGREAPERRLRGLGVRRGGIVHVRQLSLISDFLQEIVARSVSLKSSQIKSKEL